MTVLLGLLPHLTNLQGAAKFHVTKQKLHFRHHHDAVVKRKAPGVVGRRALRSTGFGPGAARYRSGGF
jgi:hypothetical protein